MNLLEIIQKSIRKWIKENRDLIELVFPFMKKIFDWIFKGDDDDGGGPGGPGGPGGSSGESEGGGGPGGPGGFSGGPEDIESRNILNRNPQSSDNPRVQ